MSDSGVPGLTISFDTPPPSPDRVVIFSPEESSEKFQDTPKRKARFVQNQPKKKKQIQRTSQPSGSRNTPEQPQNVAQSQQYHGNLPQQSQSQQPLNRTEFPESWDLPVAPEEYTPEDSAPGPSDINMSDYAVGPAISDDVMVDLEENYQLFVEAVQAEECGFWQLSRSLFIANGWDMVKKIATNSWYHSQQIKTAGGMEIACLCPESKVSTGCLHTRFLREHGDERFPGDSAISVEDERTFLFSRFIIDYEDNSDTIFNNLFSVYSPGLMASIKTRAIVEHEGTDTGSGRWTCSKDARVQNCTHIVSARDTLQQHIQLDRSAKDPGIDRDFLVFNEPPTRHASHAESVSYERIPPAGWARIPSDPQPPDISLLEQAPDIIRLGPSSSCCCNSLSRTLYDPSQPITTMSCEIYGLTRMWTSRIEIQRCPSCKRRNIGPECREIGLFNWNNRVLFMHDVLEDYTSSYTTSETPIRSWVLTISRRYMTHKSMDFVSHKRFASIWFAYAKLLDLNNDMTCPKCGPTPKVTIWDGVTLAFNRKNILPSLRPPTTIHKDAPERSETKYPITPQCIEKKDLRKLVRIILVGPHLNPYVLDLQEEEGENPMLDDDTAINKTSRDKAAKIKADKAMRERLDLIPDVSEKLSKIDPNLGNLFKRCYGMDALKKGTLTHEVYRQFLLQISAEESALQLMTRPALKNMEVFLKNPGIETLPQLTMVPALYNVVQHELNSRPTIPADIFGTFRWLLIRGWTVLYSMMSELPSEEQHKKDVTSEDNILDWPKTGSCYSMPQIRHRPFYPRLANDGQLDKGGRDSKGEGCQKYFLKYGQQGLTGGLMCVWCSHSICYGFHCIPIAEGRNEVFSAIYTHWEKAPEFVVYDFACNLEPYCMTREADFFADTTFIIDKFHSTGHTKCGKASFLNNYVPTNPSLVEVNDSAAECGNGGINRIRKSVSYMTQERAIIYAKVYLSYFNRAQILRILQNRKKYGRL